jgi:hypothetical protein
MKERAIRLALNEANDKWSKGLLISCNHINYDELMSNPSTDDGDRETVYSIASLYSDDEDNDGTWEEAILYELHKIYKSYF